MNRVSFSPVAFLFVCAAVLLAGPPGATLAQISPQGGQKVQIELLSEKRAVRPGDTVTLALRQTIHPGWHTYWVNPGDSGEPTRIDWQLPAGASAGPIQWPLPDAIPVGPLMNFGYSDEVLLLTEITVPDSASGSSFDITADAKWLVCEEICIPEEASTSLSLPLLDGAMSPLPSPHTAAIRTARNKVPEPKPWPAQFDVEGKAVALNVANTAAALPENAKIRFFPLKWGEISHAAAQSVSFDGGELKLLLSREEQAGDTMPEALEGVLAVEAPGADGAMERRGYSISAAPADLEFTAPVTQTLLPGSAQGDLSLMLALGFALLGGLILNLMPCVFPVLSLKALSLARDAGDSEARRVKGLVYLAGVMASFGAIALAVIALRQGGMAIGWGMQFQSPAFVLSMMALFLVLALNLSGVFTLGGSIAGIGDGLARRSGYSGYFFTGVLATVVATPCTAPFMGAAMGFAFTQPPLSVLAVLLALGFGFALPIVLLSLTPALGRWLPKPGPWMETFKQVMAFPLYATVGWLLWVLSVQQGSDGVLAGVITLVGVAFAAWLFGRTFDAGPLRNAVSASVAVIALGLGIWSVSGATPEGAAIEVNGRNAAGPEAESFTRARLGELIAEDRPVFINLTAAWCITCKVNERVALRSERVADAFKDRNLAYLVGDWTNGDPEITALLKEHGRVGVPLYLLYSGKPGAPPEILPQLLTESMILDRLAGLDGVRQQAKKDL
ncbi:MAG: protein-disulfide reductase DsbD family protein [Rhodomicrobiaceae bacterium]